MRADTIDDFDLPEVLQKYYPGGFYGYNKEGCPIYIEVMGYADIKGILKIVEIAKAWKNEGFISGES